MIRIRLFGIVRESVDFAGTEIDASGINTVRDVWSAISSDMPPDEHLYCSVNHEYSSMNASVKDGDEVAFFPPVTGG